ncbi:MAG TPA: CsbD family protein [Caulobacteraceae bacterium]|nr:CsbD family protein [Caulobacteraceae bacterium]
MVDRDRIEGSGRKMGGDLKEGAGRILGDSKLQAEGRADQAAGKTQNFWGSLKDMFRGDRTRDRRM